MMTRCLVTYLSLAALLSACGTDPATTTVANDESSSSDEGDDEDSNEASNPPDPTTSGGGTTTTGDDTTTSQTSTTTGETSTGGTTTDDPSTTTGGAAGCMATAECDAGFCWFDYAGETPMEDEFTCHDVCVDDMGAGNSEDAWCLDAESCCTANSECNPMGYCVPAGADTDTDTDTTGDTDTDTDTGTTGDTDTDTDTDTGGFLPLLTISELNVFANCQPMVPADPVAASWSLDVDNSGGDVELTAVLTKATITYTPGMGEFVQEIKATPGMIGPVAKMAKTMTPMKKTMAVNNLPNDCDRCGDPVTLELTFDVDGMDTIVLKDAMLACAF